MNTQKVETIPAAVIKTAVEWAGEFVKETDPMTATEAMGKFSFGDVKVFKNVRDVCRILCNYHSLANIILDMLKKRGITEHEFNVVWDILSKYADPVDPRVFFGKGD